MKKNSGIALIFSLGVLSILLAVGISFISRARLEQKASANYLAYIKCGFAARAGAEHAFAVLKAQRDDGFDSFRSAWRTDFAGSDHDNSGDGINDSAWIDFFDAGGGPAGRYALLVEDESGKLNLNRSGNLSLSAGEGSAEHGRNEGWTTFEISIAEVLAELAFPAPAGLAAAIVRERYGGHDDAGGYGFNLALPLDGIDNDGSGSVSSTDPMGFTPWKPDAGLGHKPFLEATHTAIVSPVFRRNMDIMSSHATVYSRSADSYIRSGSPRDRVNINLFDCPLVLYRELSGISGISDEAACRLSVNILDYRDDNGWISRIESPSTGNVYYGIESVMINEVLCNSHHEDTERRVNNSGSEMTFIYSGLAPRTAYRVSVGLAYSMNPRNVRFRVNAGAWQTADGGGDSVLWRLFHYHDIRNSVSDASGNIAISVDYRKTRPHEDLPFTGSVSIWNVHFVAAEFVELVNIGGGEVLLDGWEIKTVSDLRSNVQPVPAGSIRPGEYLALTNDIELFEISYGGLNAVEIPGWESGYASSGELPHCGNFEMHVYIDRKRGLKADLTLDGLANRMPGISPPGQSSGIGVSREKSDPSSRTFWMDNARGRATPCRDNSILPAGGRDVLSGLRAGMHPPLVKNNLFATIGEITETEDWQKGGIKYPGVRSGASPWAPVSPHDLGRIAERISAGHFLRFDRASAEAGGPGVTWQARLDRNFGRGGYGLFFYGDYNGEGPDIAGAGRGGFEFKESGGVYAGGLASPEIGPGGSFGFGLRGDFDYAALAPDSVHGRININTASYEVLRGVPSFCSETAEAVIEARTYAPFTSVGGLLSRNVIPPSRFAPAANLITAASDVFRVICTARTPHPSDPGDPELFTSQRRVEAVLDRSGGILRVLSWKEIH